MSWKDRAVLDQGTKTKLNWKSRAQAVQSGESSDVAGAARAGLDSFADAATLGYLPHLQAAADWLVPDPNADLDEKLREQGFNVQTNDPSYVERRDRNARRLERQSEEHPVASAIGTGAGIVSTALVPVGAASKGASLAEKAYRGAKAGAKIGALANPGDIEGEAGLQIDERISNAATGAALGGAAPLAVKGAEKLAGAAGKVLRDKGALKATRALGRPKPTQARKMAKSGQDVELGRELLDKKAVPLLGTPKRIAKRVSKIKEQAGREIDDLIKNAGDGDVINAKKIADSILDSEDFLEMKNIPGMEATVAAIEKQASTLAKNGTITLKQAQKLRQGIDRSINFNKAAPDMRGAQEGLYQQRTAIRDAMDEGISRLSDDVPKGSLKAANRRYANMSVADDILDSEIARNQANRSVSLTDTISGGSGAVIGGMIGGPAGATAGAVAGAGLNKFGRSFGNSLQARGYNAAGKALEGGARVAEKVTPRAASIGAIRGGTMTPDLEKQDDPILNDKRLLGVFEEDPSLIDLIEDKKRRERVRKHIQKQSSKGKEPNRKPAARGQAKWIERGAEKVQLSQTVLKKAKASKKGQRLLMQASDLKKSSKAMERVREKLQKEFGEN
tara:strand:+ start:5119 stop:6975 length:1857 start_codon:yes stop_codon:yes gene_type:complete